MATIEAPNKNRNNPMYVYILKSTEHIPTKYYVGSTTNLKERLQRHNSGLCKHTSPYRPWTFKNFFWFSEPPKALA